MKRSSRPHTTAELSKPLHQQLNMYALAASAAGVGLLALTPPTEAKIVYTRANVALNGSLPLDLDHNGTVDFYLHRNGPFRVSRSGSLSYLSVCQHISSQFNSVCGGTSSHALNAVIINAAGAAALSPGAIIQPGRKFSKQPALMGYRRINLCLTTQCHGTTSSNIMGNWLNGGKGVKNRYLGLKFKINGHFHFGWARLTVTIVKTVLTATLTGYAYETIPNKSIIAGKTRGPDDASVEASNKALTVLTPIPATLGALALGSPGLSVWRREESAVAAQ
jgi:hypothetical protein